MKITEEIYQKIELDKIDIKCASNGPLRNVYKMAVQIHVHKIDKCLQFLCLIFLCCFCFILFFFIKSPGIIMMYKQDIEHSLLTRK